MVPVGYPQDVSDVPHVHAGTLKGLRAGGKQAGRQTSGLENKVGWLCVRGGLAGVTQLARLIGLEGDGNGNGNGRRETNAQQWWPEDKEASQGARLGGYTIPGPCADLPKTIFLRRHCFVWIPIRGRGRWMGR